MNESEKLKTAALDLSAAVSKLKFIDTITHIYNPLDYAWDAHALYLERFGCGKKKIIFVGMNPGPWGMAQTGVPFGEIAAVTDWLGIRTEVGKPAQEHPKRIIEGFDCSRSEVSGKRFWGLMAERFGNPENFAEDHYVANYCPISFMTETGKNFTPDKLPKDQQDRLFEVCDIHLRATAEILDADWVLGIGKFAEQRINAALQAVIESGKVKSGTVLHPSPASPAANRGWSEAAVKKMRAYELWV